MTFEDESKHQLFMSSNKLRDSKSLSSMANGVSIALSERQRCMLIGLNREIKSYLQGWSSEAFQVKDYKKNTDGILNSTISRAIVQTIPLYLKSVDLTDIIRQVGTTQIPSILVKKGDSVELITKEHIINFITEKGNFENRTLSDVGGLRLSFVDREITIKEALRKMNEDKVPMLMVQFTPEEKQEFCIADTLVQNGREVKMEILYPKVVTWNTIYSMLMETMIEDGLLRDQKKIELDSTVFDSSDSSLSDTIYGNPLPLLLSSEVPEGEYSNHREFLILVYLYPMTFLTAADILLSWAYILDYVDYFNSLFFQLVTMYFFIDCFARVVFGDYRTVKGLYTLLINILDMIILVCSLGFSLMDCRIAKGCSQILKTTSLFRLARVYKLVTQQIKVISKKIKANMKRSRKQDQDDLDVVTITRRILAMSWPGMSIYAMWRNNMSDVEAYLNDHFGGNYLVVNLCAESGYQKGSQPFGGRYIRYCIYDHYPCSIDQILTIVKDIEEWFNKDKGNVVVVHCKGGKGRTGMIISCLLLKLGIQLNPGDALNMFATGRTDIEVMSKKRKQTYQCVSRASQIQYVFYYHYILTHGMPRRRGIKLRFISVPDKGSDVILRVFEIRSPDSSGRRGSTMHVKTSRKNENTVKSHQGYIEYKKLMIEKKMKSGKVGDNQSVFYYVWKDKDAVKMDGDIVVEVTIKSSLQAYTCSVWFNTAFQTERDFAFQHYEINDAKDKDMFIRLIIDDTEMEVPEKEDKTPFIPLDANESRQMVPEEAKSYLVFPKAHLAQKHERYASESLISEESSRNSLGYSDILRSLYDNYSSKKQSESQKNVELSTFSLGTVSSNSSRHMIHMDAVEEQSNKEKNDESSIGDDEDETSDSDSTPESKENQETIVIKQ